ncbi:MAG: hypothetical protein WCF84_06365 [Anaerolineae bacterium]
MKEQVMSTLSSMDAPIAQFAHGKLIDRGLDVRGYTILARSPGLPPDSVLVQLRPMADVGQPAQNASYVGSDIVFSGGDYVIAARFQRSPKSYDRGYFLQEHYLLLPKSYFAALGNNFAYLHALLPQEIPWRSQDAKLDLLSLPPRNRNDEIQRVEYILKQFGDAVFQALQLCLENRPFAIIAGTSASEEQTAFLQTIALLVPPPIRPHFSWALNVQDVKRCQARLKIAGDQSVGMEGHEIVRLQSASITNQLTAPNPAQHALQMLRDYLQHFGVPALLQVIEALALPETLQWHEISAALDSALYQKIAPTLFERQAGDPRFVNSKLSSEQARAMLDSDVFNLSPEQRALFLCVLIDGILEQHLDLADANRLPRDVKRVRADLLWPRLGKVFRTTNTPRDARRWHLLANWRKDWSFWSGSEFQEWLYGFHVDEITSRAGQPESALKHLRFVAAQQLLPTNIAQQSHLLRTVASSTRDPATFKPETLIETWADLSSTPDAAWQFLREVTPLQSYLSPQGYFGFIPIALQGGAPLRIDQMLAGYPDTELDSRADLFIALVLLGERFKLQGFRASRILAVLGRYAEKELSAGRPSPRLSLLLQVLTEQPQALDDRTRAVVANWALQTGQWESYKRLLAGDSRLIDPILNWLDKAPIASSNYQQTLAVALDWFRNPPANLVVGERNMRLQRLFDVWTSRTTGNEKINDLTLLMLYDAFRGEYVLPPAKSPGWRPGHSETFISKVVAGITHIHKAVVPASSPLPHAYIGFVEQAFREAWTHPEWTRQLIEKLNKENLGYEATNIAAIASMRRGGNSQGVNNPRNEMLAPQSNNQLQAPGTLRNDMVTALSVNGEQFLKQQRLFIELLDAIYQFIEKNPQQWKGMLADKQELQRVLDFMEKLEDTSAETKDKIFRLKSRIKYRT